MNLLNKYKKLSEKLFEDESLGILTPVFNPIYPSLKYVFIPFLIIRLIFYICTLGLHNPNIHIQFITGAISILFSMIASGCFDSYYTERAEFMECISFVFGVSTFLSFFICRSAFPEDISAAYYILFVLDVLFFLYACTIRFKEIKFNKNPKKYLIKHGYEKEDEAPIEKTSEIRYMCGRMFNNLNDDEKAILEEPFKKIENLFFNSYDSLSRDVHDDYAFFETAEFIKDLDKVIKTYRKTKVLNNIEYLEKVRDSMDDFYETAKNHNMDVNKERFQGAIEELKVRVGRFLWLKNLKDF